MPLRLVVTRGGQTLDAAMQAVCDEAIARGVFGIPTVLVDDELFWGDDRLEEAAARATSASTPD
jgi:2-hydroxychromene-2-carboxylate isomerase